MYFGKPNVCCINLQTKRG